MATGNDPYGQFNFQLKIDGIIVAGFSEVSGLTKRKKSYAKLWRTTGGTLNIELKT
jgi:hypothetical protein